MTRTTLRPRAASAPALLVAAIASAWLAALGGCAVGPDYRPVPPQQLLPEHFPPPGDKPSAASPAVDWWRSFDDSGLDMLVAAALRNSPDVVAAEAHVRESRAASARARSAGLPQLDAQARSGRDQFSRNSENFANIPFPDPKSTFHDERIEFDASWEIDLFGHTARAVEAASARTQGMQAQRADIELRVSAETARNALDFRYVSLRIAAAAAAVSANEQVVRLVRLQRDVGLASDTAVQQAEIGLSDARAALPSLQAAARASIVALLPLTTLTEQQITASLGDAPRLPGLPTSRAFAASSTVLERRPDVRAAERALAAATADVGEATANRYPRFTLLADGGWDSIHPGELVQRASRFWNLGPQLYLPLFDGERIEAGIRSAQAGRDAAQAGYRKAVLTALADVESAMLRCQADDGRLVESAAALDLQRRQVDLDRMRVDAGESSRIDLLADQLRQIAAEDRQLAIRQALSENLVLLYKALGGGTPAAE